MDTISQKSLYRYFLVQRKTGKKGARFGNKIGEEARRLVNLELVAGFEGVSHSALSQKLKKQRVTLAEYLANIIKDYGMSLELDLAEVGTDKKKKKRTMTTEAFLLEILKKIYEENPQLKSQRKKPGKKTAEPGTNTA